MTASHTTDATLMRQEVIEIPDAIQRLLDAAPKMIEPAAKAIRAGGPKMIATIARGSSDHCTTYLKYAFEIGAGIPVASLGPSVASIYGARLELAGCVTISISQSGMSPDIVEATRAAGGGGAVVVSITNNAQSPLAGVSDHTFDIAAGPERSVAATKTFVNSLIAGLLLLGHWRGNTDLLQALHKLPQQCRHALDCGWDPLISELRDARSLYVLGRGPSFAVANEVALKFKETCQMQAEAYSAAEVMHGPVSIVGEGFPVLALAGRDASLEPTLTAVSGLAANKAKTFTTAGKAEGAVTLDTAASGHPLTDPIPTLVSFYSFVETLARARGRNPDAPPNLRKVTQTA